MAAPSVRISHFRGMARSGSHRCSTSANSGARRIAPIAMVRAYSRADAIPAAQRNIRVQLTRCRPRIHATTTTSPMSSVAAAWGSVIDVGFHSLMNGLIREIARGARSS